jgi:hypothetical protein
MLKARRRRVTRAFAVTATAGAIAIVASATLSGAASPGLTGVPNAQPKSPGFSEPNVISPELALIERARGSMKLENGTADIPYYGYDGDGPQLPAPGDVPTPTHKVEATKSEPDKNTYLVLQNQKGADPSYDYGTHFLFQGHELGLGYITRVNLDADVAHRVTLLATKDSAGAPIATIDGSTWDPFAQKLIFTTESNSVTGAYQASLDVPSTVDSLIGSFGKGGYEATQNDSNGNVWLVEDIGGTTVPTAARNPNSFVYRFVPDNPSDLTKGKLQVLQLTSLRTGNPITFQAVDALHPTGGVFTDDTKDMHTYGHTFTTKFVTIHDTSVDGTTPFDANALAKAKGGTPFKRPENGVFKPGSKFTQFFFDETGDTNATSTANANFGGWGGVDKLTLDSPGSDTGKLSVFFVGDIDHTSFDNTNFWDKNTIVFVEDRGDTLHTQHNALDSAWMFDATADYSNPANQPLRLIAQGRDPSATIDSAFSALGNGFQNEGDNEITGFHVSDGDPTPQGILGAKNNVNLFHNGWRAFFTNQHGDNITDEIVADPANAKNDG